MPTNLICTTTLSMHEDTDTFQTSTNPHIAPAADDEPLYTNDLQL